MIDELQDVFHAAAYTVRVDDKTLTLRIGAPCPARLRNWIRVYCGARPAWLITPCNPGATPVCAAQNAAREQLLQDWARLRASAWLNTVNRDPSGEWPDEPGLLIAGVEEGQARAQARRFGQLAMVAVQRDCPAALIWLEKQSPAGQRSE